MSSSAAPLRVERAQELLKEGTLLVDQEKYAEAFPLLEGALELYEKVAVLAAPPHAALEWRQHGERVCCHASFETCIRLSQPQQA